MHDETADSESEVTKIRQQAMEETLEQLFDFSFLHIDENSNVPALQDTTEEVSFNIGSNSNNTNNINEILRNLF